MLKATAEKIPNSVEGMQTMVVTIRAMRPSLAYPFLRPRKNGIMPSKNPITK
jgi:hypothetical protein